MSAGATWWQPWSKVSPWLVLDRDDHLLGAASALWHGPQAPGGAFVAEQAIVEELDIICAADPFARRAHLHALWHRHGPDTISARERVAVPNRLWDRFLAFLGEPARVRSRPIWPLPGSGAFAHGGATSSCTEWWLSPDTPGVGYDESLWAWGAVHEPPGAAHAMWSLSPRLVWRAGRSSWHLHPHLDQVWREARDSAWIEHTWPRVHDGPGFLLACAVDALADLYRARPSSSGRELSLLWGTHILPLLAVSVEQEAFASPVGRALPEFMHTLPFHLLHPRVQRTLAVVHRVCERLRAADVSPLEQLLEHLGPTRADASEPRRLLEHTTLWLRELVERALLRGADSDGFGFKRVGECLYRELCAPNDDASRADALSDRLYRAVDAALSYPGSPSYPGGAMTRQFTDLVWLRWTDQDFLSPVDVGPVW